MDVRVFVCAMHGHCVEAVDREAYAALEGRPWHDHVHDATRTHVLHGVTTTQRERTFSTGYSSTANRTGCVSGLAPVNSGEPARLTSHRVDGFAE